MKTVLTLDEAYNSGFWNSLKGLKEKKRDLEKFAKQNPDNDQVLEYLDEVEECIYEAKLERE